MGMTYVDVTVRNPAQRARAWTGAFLVDTGAIDSLAPRRTLEAIGLKPTRRRVYVTADGRAVEMDVAVGELEIMGELSGGIIVFGDDGVEPLLGVTALESAGIEVDPRNQQLKRLPAVRLRGQALREEPKFSDLRGSANSCFGNAGAFVRTMQDQWP